MVARYPIAWCMVLFIFRAFPISYAYNLVYHPLCFFKPLPRTCTSPRFHICVLSIPVYFTVLGSFFPRVGTHLWVWAGCWVGWIILYRLQSFFGFALDGLGNELSWVWGWDTMCESWNVLRPCYNMYLQCWLWIQSDCMSPVSNVRWISTAIQRLRRDLMNILWDLIHDMDAPTLIKVHGKECSHLHQQYQLTDLKPCTYTRSPSPGLTEYMYFQKPLRFKGILALYYTPPMVATMSPPVPFPRYPLSQSSRSTQLSNSRTWEFTRPGFCIHGILDGIGKLSALGLG